MALRSGRVKVQSAIIARSDFRQASMRGEHHSSGDMANFGRLPEEHRTALKAITGPVFVVYSYGTPIGWHSDAGWTIPRVSYSVTTLNHQTVMRSAVIDYSE